MYREFSIPSPIIFGCGAISILGEKVKEKGCKKVLIICEKAVEDAGIIAKATKSLDMAGVAYAIYNGVIADPPDKIVDEAGEMAKREDADCLVGLGGGSSLDTAKAAAILMTNPGPVSQYICALPMYVDTKAPLILIPTTAGTGSECTSVAIISRPDQNAKWSVFVNSSLAIVDPELTVTVPKSVTAMTGMDALAHAVEGMTNTQGNRHCDLFAIAAIEKIFKNLATCCDEPTNIEARSEMALAANWAGLAFNNPIVHVGHAIADALSINFHTPHGHNCALALPEAIAIVAPVIPDRIVMIAKAIGLSLTGNETGSQLGTMVSDAVRKLMRNIGIPSLHELGHTRETVISLKTDVVSSFLSTLCPVTIDEPTAEKLLAAVYDNYL
ncbi:MAG: iron-containing alcohol dehydrogenase [Oscillospiraceae bacterium]|nr:iron-containing alcohol dehydrogenase [Oscillospiraceae bacterium]